MKLFSNHNIAEKTILHCQFFPISCSPSRVTFFQWAFTVTKEIFLLTMRKKIVDSLKECHNFFFFYGEILIWSWIYWQAVFIRSKIFLMYWNINLFNFLMFSTHDINNIYHIISYHILYHSLTQRSKKLKCK